MIRVHAPYIAEHGARAGTLYGSCCCGWSGRPRRSQDAAGADARAHIVGIVTAAEDALDRLPRPEDIRT